MNDPDNENTIPPSQPSTLRPDCERFAAEFTQQVLDDLNIHLKVTSSTWQRQSYADFLAGLREPASCWLMSMGDRSVWLELSTVITRMLVDQLLGDSGRVSSQSPTPVDRRLLTPLVLAAGQCAANTWPIEGQLDINPPSPAATHRTDGDDAVTVLTFELVVGDTAGQMRMCIPQDLVGAQSLPQQQAYMRGPIEISAAVADFEVDQDDLSSLAVGDIIVTDADCDGEVIVRTAGIPKYTARAGVCNGKRAVTITGRLSGASEQQAPAE